MYVWSIATLVMVGLLFWLFSRGAFDDLAFVQRFYAKAVAADSSLEGRGYFAFLQRAGQRYGFEVISTRTFLEGEDRVSSTRIRQALAEGGLADKQQQPLQSLSGGELRRAEIARLRARADELAQAQQSEEVEKAQQKELTRAGRSRGGRNRQTVMESFFKSAARAVGSQVGRQLIRGVLGSLFGGRR